MQHTAHTLLACTEYTSPHLHKALLVNLPAEHTVYYQVGDPVVGMSSVLSFKTPPKVGSHPNKGQPFEIAVLADLGQTADSLSTVQHVVQDTNALLVLQAGDLACE
jgi:acid phosphatase type 7